MANTSKYTYVDFAQDVMELTAQMSDREAADRIYAKAQALIDAQLKKAEYNATHPKKNVAKGASSATMKKANAIKGVLSATPMTAAEINAALNEDYTALQVANAVKYIDGVTVSKVIRTMTNAKGLTAQKEYTAYAIS